MVQPGFESGSIPLHRLYFSFFFFLSYLAMLPSPTVFKFLVSEFTQGQEFCGLTNHQPRSVFIFVHNDKLPKKVILFLGIKRKYQSKNLFLLDFLPQLHATMLPIDPVQNLSRPGPLLLLHEHVPWCHCLNVSHIQSHSILLLWVPIFTYSEDLNKLLQLFAVPVLISSLSITIILHDFWH